MLDTQQLSYSYDDEVYISIELTLISSKTINFLSSPIFHLNDVPQNGYIFNFLCFRCFCSL